MKVPISWLKEYVEFEDSTAGLADKLTFAGVEVEGIETFGEGLDGVVVGEVTAVHKHPNADKLKLCDVTDGSEEYRVVCGAPNVEAGGKYPFAPVGTVLPNGLKLKKAKIRGEVSMGMLCAEDELGLSDDHEGLMVLNPESKPGTPLTEIVGPPETVLDLEITPNRPDCLSMIGIAREVAAIYESELKVPDVTLEESGEPAESQTRVDIEDAERCPRYTARILKDIEMGPAPDWMQKRLALAGVRPISNVVDITNYVMLESGHPLHAFDQTFLKEGRIVVRRARANEKMETLDDVERDLTDDMLVIADAEVPVALAGIMGGAGSEIRDNTRTVLLESAYFAPDPIRRTSRNLALTSESAYRFERGTDINNAEWASRRAAALMAAHANAKVAPGVVDACPKPQGPWQVSCRTSRTNTLLGIEISTEKIGEIMKRLGLKVVEQNDDKTTVEIPTFRGDLEREVDLIEEVARIHGLDQIPSPAPQSRIVPGSEDQRTRAVMACRNVMVGLGLQEIMNYSLVSQPMLDRFNAEDTKQRIVLPHPISQDQSILRTSLIPQLVESLGHNRAHQLEEASLFEIGRVFWLQNGEACEEERLSIGLMGPVGRGTLDKRREVEPGEIFLWLKGVLEQLFAAMKVTDWKLTDSSHVMMEPEFVANILVNGKPAGSLGIVRRVIREEWRLNDPIAVAEIAVEPLLTNIFKVERVEDPPAYPPVSRDIALIAPADLRHEQIVKVINAHAPTELESVALFDIFKGKSIGANRKSMAYSLTYRSDARTLTDEEANGYHKTVKEALQKALDIEMREG